MESAFLSLPRWFLLARPCTRAPRCPASRSPGLPLSLPGWFTRSWLTWLRMISLQTRTSAIVMELTGGRVAWIVKAVWSRKIFFTKRLHWFFLQEDALLCIRVLQPRWLSQAYMGNRWLLCCWNLSLECYLLHRGLHHQGIIYKPDCVVEYSNIFCGVVKVYGKPSCTITDTFTNYEKGLWHPPSVHTIMKPIFVPFHGQLYCQFK